MAPVIHVQPGDAWRYYISNRKRLEEELVEIASNEEANTSVYMTDDDGMPYLYVYRDDYKIFQSECPTIYDVVLNLRAIYDKYLTPIKSADSVKEDDNRNNTAATDADNGRNDCPICADLDEMSDAEFQDMVDEREDVIYAAVQDLIEVLTEDTVGAMELYGEDDESIDSIVDHIVEYLAIKCGLRIRRPMTVVDEESGLRVRTEYPYEEFEFDESELHS